MHFFGEAKHLSVLESLKLAAVQGNRQQRNRREKSNEIKVHAEIVRATDSQSKLGTAYPLPRASVQPRLP